MSLIPEGRRQLKRATAGTRLTWIHSLPDPFESGWSLFKKIQTLNLVGADAIVGMLARDSLASRRADLRDNANSSWIDFDRFAELLETAPHILKSAFWDQHGFVAQPRTIYGIRHCRRCWSEHQYHCILFDLALLTHCPWHHCELDPLCPSCAQKTLKACHKHPLKSYDELLIRSSMTSDQRTVIIGHCREFFDWWTSLRSSAPYSEGLLSGLVSLCGLRNPIQNLNWQAGFAQSKVSLDKYHWIMRSFSPVPCLYTSVLDVGRPVETKDCTDKIRDETGLCYRSIRRHLYKSYVRHHRRCLSSFSRLMRAEYFTLIGDEICITCLAYFAWRMSVEKLVNIEGLFRRRKGNFEIQLAQVSAIRRVDYRTGLNLTLMRFFGIWHELTEKYGRGAVQVAKDVFMPPLHFYYSRDERYSSDNTIQEYHCLYPDGRHLAQQSPSRCKWVTEAAPVDLQSPSAHNFSEWGIPVRSILFILLPARDPFGVGERTTVFV